MTLWHAVVLLALSLLGIVLSHRYLRKPVQSVSVILCVLLALANAAYIGLPFFSFPYRRYCSLVNWLPAFSSASLTDDRWKRKRWG